MKQRLFGYNAKWWEILVGSAAIAAPFIAILASM